MKTIILYLIVSFSLISITNSQTLSNWKHYYAPINYGFDFGNYYAYPGPEEIVLFDKSTYAYTRIPFPPDARQYSNHDTTRMPRLEAGPGNTLKLFADTSVIYLFDGTNWNSFNNFLGFNPGQITFYNNPGGSQFFIYKDSLCKYDGNTITYYCSSNSPYTANSYYFLFNDSDDIFMASDYEVNINLNGTWMNFDTTYFGMHYIYISASAGNSNHFMFASSIDSMLHIFSTSNGSWSAIPIPSSLNHSVNSLQINSTFYDLNGNLWISGDSLFCMYDGSQFYDFNNNIPWTNTCYYVSVTTNLSNNNLLLSVSGVNYIYNTITGVSTLAPADSRQVLSGNNIYPSLKDNNGNLWFGAYGWGQQNGLMRYKNNSWNILPLSGQSINGSIYTIVQDSGQRIVFGYGDLSSNGPICVDSSNSIFRLDLLNHMYHTVEDIAIDHNHHYWFGGGGAGVPLGIIEFISGTPFYHTNPSSSDNPYSIAVDSLNNKWISYDSFNGVYNLTGSVFTNYNTSNSPLPNDTVVKIIIQPNSNILWFCTSGGFAKYENGNWTIYDATNTPLPDSRAEYVYWDNQGVQWFATQKGGFATLYNNTWNVYTVYNSPLDNGDIESIVVDDNCTAWICTEGGITSVDEGCGIRQGAFISGTILQSNSAPAINALVRIYKLNNSGTDLIQVENTFTDNLGHYNVYVEDTTGIFYVHTDANELSFPGELAAYEDSSFVVQQSASLSLSANGHYTVNVKMRQTQPNQGTFTFNGILQSSTERTGNVNLVLMLNGFPVANAISSYNGTFRFNDLAVGNYELWVDKPGLNNSIAPLIVIDSISNSANFYFELYPNRLELLTTGLTSHDLISAINIFPNPCHDKITVHSSNSRNEKITIRIYNGYGKLFQEKIIYSSEDIDIRNLPNGIYFLKLDMNETIITRKIVKI